MPYKNCIVVLKFEPSSKYIFALIAVIAVVTVGIKIAVRGSLS